MAVLLGMIFNRKGRPRLKYESQIIGDVVCKNIAEMVHNKLTQQINGV